MKLPLSSLFRLEEAWSGKGQSSSERGRMWLETFPCAQWSTDLKGSVWRVDKWLRVYLAKTSVTKGGRDWKDCQDLGAQQWWWRSQPPGTGSTQPSVQAGCWQQGLTSKNFSYVPNVISTSIQINNLSSTIFHIHFSEGYQSFCKYSILTDLRKLWGLYQYTLRDINVGITFGRKWVLELQEELKIQIQVYK